MNLVNGIRVAVAILLLNQCLHPLLAQSEFQQAHEKVVAYFDKTSVPIKNLAPPERSAFYKEAKSLAEQLPGQVIPLINAGILDYLRNTPRISTDDLTIAIGRALTAPSVEVHSVGDEEGSVAIVFSPRLDAYAIGYNVTTCAVCTDGWIGIFKHGEHGWILAERIDKPLLGEEMRLAFIGSGRKPLLLQYGTGYGDPHRGLYVHLYSLSNGVKQVWSLLDQYEGELDLSGNHFTVKSWTAIRWPYQEKEQDFEIVDGGVRLSSTKLSSPRF